MTGKHFLVRLAVMAVMVLEAARGSALEAAQGRLQDSLNRHAFVKVEPLWWRPDDFEAKKERRTLACLIKTHD